MTRMMTTRRCRDCARPMRPKHRRADGVTTRHHGYGYCERCYLRRLRAGTLPEVEGDRKRPYRAVRRCLAGETCDRCEDVGDLDRLGVSPWDWAERLDTNPVSMQRQLYRHGKSALAQKMAPIVNDIRGPHQRREKVAA